MNDKKTIAELFGDIVIKNDEIADLKKQLAITKENYEMIESECDFRGQNLDKAGVENKTLRKQLAAKDAEIAELKEQVNQYLNLIDSNGLKKDELRASVKGIMEWRKIKDKNTELKAEVASLKARRLNVRELLKVVNEQSGDKGLWFIAATAPEDYLQCALKKIHKAIADAKPWKEGK